MTFDIQYERENFRGKNMSSEKKFSEMTEAEQDEYLKGDCDIVRPLVVVAIMLVIGFIIYIWSNVLL